MEKTGVLNKKDRHTRLTIGASMNDQSPSLRAGGRADVRAVVATPAPVESRAAVEDAEATDAAGVLARHRTGQIEVVSLDDGGVMDVNGDTLDHIHPDLERQVGRSTIDRLAVAIPEPVLTEHPADAGLGAVRVVRDKRIVLTGVHEAGEPAILLESDLLDDAAVDEPNVLSEESRVRRRPERDLRDGLERVLPLGIEVNLKGRASEHTSEPDVVETTGLSGTNGLHRDARLGPFDDGLSLIVADASIRDATHEGAVSHDKFENLTTSSCFHLFLHHRPVRQHALLGWIHHVARERRGPNFTCGPPWAKTCQRTGTPSIRCCKRRDRSQKLAQIRLFSNLNNAINYKNFDKKSRKTNSVIKLQHYEQTNDLYRS